MIKNILFDMGGVIFLQDTAEAFRRFREAGIDPDIYMGEHGQKDFFLEIETGEIGMEEFCRKMAKAAHRNSVTREEALHCWLGFVKGVEQERLDYLEELRPAYHLSLLTNTNPFIMSHMRSSSFSPSGHPITHYFDSLFCSYEMECYKPSTEFFSHVLKHDSLIAEECLFIDDSLKNIRTAESVGIRGMHVRQNADWRASLAEVLQQS